METINYIIPMCNTGSLDFYDRIASLNFSLEHYLAKQTQVKIRLILVEQVLNPNNDRFIDAIVIPKNFKGECITKTVHYPVFVKGWLYNIGVNLSEGPHIFITETDMFYEHDILHDILEFRRLNNNSWLFCWDHLIMCSKNDTDIIMETKKAHISNNCEYIRPKVGYKEGGLVYVDRSTWYKIGGANEFLIGLGGIDNDLAWRLKKETESYKMFPMYTYHLYHSPSPLKSNKSRIDNRKIFVQLRDAKYADNFMEIQTKEGIGGDSPLCKKINIFQKLSIPNYEK